MRKSLKITLVAAIVAVAGFLLPSASPLVAQTTGTTPGYYDVPAATQSAAAKTARTEAKKAIGKLTLAQLLRGKKVKIKASGAGTYAITIRAKGKVVARGSRVVKRDTTKNAEIQLRPTAAADDILDPGTEIKLSIQVSVRLAGQTTATIAKTSVTID